MNETLNFYETLMAESLLRKAEEGYRETGNFGIISQVRKIVRIPRFRFKLYPYYIEHLLDRGKFVTAELLARSYLQKANGEEETVHRVKDSLFIAVMEQNRVEEAVNILIELILEEPFPYRVSMLAWFYEMMGDYEKAISFYQAAYLYSFRYGVSGENYLRKLIRAMFDYGQIDENYELLIHAREVYGDKPWIMFFTAKWYYMKGSYEKAKKFLSKLLRSGGAEKYAIEARKLLKEIEQLG